MKITNFYCKIMNISMYSNWIFFFMETDCGLTGYGEASLDGNEFKVEELLNNIKHRYIGKNPIKDDFAHMACATNLVEAATYSAIDMCVWDLKGKYYNKPVYEMIGDLYNPDIKMYATFNRALKTRDTNDFADISKMLIDRGFTGIKCAPFDNFTWQAADSDSYKYLERGVERFKAIRNAVGEDIQIRVDNHWRFNYEISIEVANMLRTLNPYWFEAPVSEKDGYEVFRVRQAVGMKIAGAEMQFNLESLSTLFENDALDIYMFDIKYIGGITGMLRANEKVKYIGKMLSPHNMTGPVATAASLHVCAVSDNLDSLEYHLEENTIINQLSDLDLTLKKGKVSVPSKPGLGVELNIDAIESNPYKPTIAFRANMLGA